MQTTYTFEFTRRPDMYAEHTFEFTFFTGAIIFAHEWDFKCYNSWGKYTGSGSDANIHLPYDTQLKVKDMWGKQNFGRLYIEVLEVTNTSIKIKYWIKCYHPGEWYSGLTYEGKLTCITGAELPEETVRSYSDATYATEKTVFDPEEIVYVEARGEPPGLLAWAPAILRVVSDSADVIVTALPRHSPGRYRGIFKITAASTNPTLFQIHLDLGERAVLSCDVDHDGQAATHEIWCQVGPEPPPDPNATHFRIQVNTQIDMLGTMMWDSQKCPLETLVAPDERCPDIEYAGSQLDLSGRTTYWWRIKFWTDNGAIEGPWSIEEAYFRGPRVIVPPDYEEVVTLGRRDIRKPRGRAEVEIDKEWIDLQKVTAIQISNNKNPLDNIETTQGTVYLSNIDQEFYPDKTTSQFFDQLFGRRIRMSLGFLDYPDTGEEKFLYKMMGIVKSVNTNRSEKTAEIVALEFMDFYRTKQIKVTPVYEDLSLTELYCALVQHCFPSWLNQHETADWDYWIDPLGFRRTNTYIGTGKLGGVETIPIRDCSRIPCEWIYNIAADSEAVYDDEGFRLFRGQDYEIIKKTTDKGEESWIHFLKEPYPTNKDGFYVACTVDVRVRVVQYKDTTLIEELEEIAMVADCRLYADEYGRLICKSNELAAEATDTISHDKNLMNLSTRKDIDSIINHVVVESKPYQIGARIELGTWEITFSRRPAAEAGVEYTFSSEEFVENFRFDLTWSLQCSQWLGDCVGSGSENDFELPFTCNLPLVGAVGCTKIYGHLYIEPVSFDSKHIRVKFYLNCIHDTHYDNAIVFTASLTCHAEGIGQPETYRGEAIDEASYQDRYVGRKKRTFTLEYLEPGDTQARQAAEALLASLRKIRIYYDCEIRGLPHLRLMDTLALTEPKAGLSEKKLQVIKLIDNMQVANYTGEVGLMERKTPSAIPFYWETAEHDFIITNRAQLSQTFKFIFDSEIISYKFSHTYSVTAVAFMVFHIRNCTGNGTDENLDLSYSVKIVVYYEDQDGEKHPLTLGILTISLIEATSTSLEVRYQLVLEEGGDVWEVLRWITFDWLGTLSCEAQFASQSPGTDKGDAPSDQPHYPPDEPYTPPDDEPDDGWEYDVKEPNIIRGTVAQTMNFAERQDVANYGLNVITFNPRWGTGANTVILDDSRKLGLGVTGSTRWSLLTESRARTECQTFGIHPAHWAYCTCDEPDIKPEYTAEMIRQTYRWIKQYDSNEPKHPVWFVLTSWGDWGKIFPYCRPGDGFDFLSIDCYPFTSAIGDPYGHMEGGWRKVQWAWSQVGRFKMTVHIQACSGKGMAADRIRYQYEWWRDRLETEDCFFWVGHTWNEINAHPDWKEEIRRINAGVGKFIYR